VQDRQAFKKNSKKFDIEYTIEAVLNRYASPGYRLRSSNRLIDTILNFPTDQVRVVVFGGGTGLSTVVGGNAQLHEWHKNPFVGLKTVFPCLDVVVCTTDDGGSTGGLLKHLPMIGIGDVRKLCLAMILHDNVQHQYRISQDKILLLVRLIQTIFNYRFPAAHPDIRVLNNPLLAAPPMLRNVCPKPLHEVLVTLGSFFSSHSLEMKLPLSGHCLGNLLLTASIFLETGSFSQPPSLAQLRSGIDRVACAIGAPPVRLHPATATPAQLVFQYTHGVTVCGQRKALTARRGFPVNRVYTQFTARPEVSPELLQAIRSADVIIIAPGSLYTSSIPVLQVPGIAEAIRANCHALKILGANFWNEEGETDLTHADRRRGFRVSELCDAYERNVPGGRNGLFQFVLSANLDNMPATILRNYALEGKRPLYLDREKVTALNVIPVEATIFSKENALAHGVVQHDPVQFALAVRTLLFAWQHQRKKPRISKTSSSPSLSLSGVQNLSMPLCHFWKTVQKKIAEKRYKPAVLKDILSELVWHHRDICAAHLSLFSSLHAVPAASWQRSTAWDNVLGYYDPEQQRILVHSRLLKDPDRLRHTILIALGESLLGNYIARRRWVTSTPLSAWGVRRYEITLRPDRQRVCFLSAQQLHRYLMLARMVPHPSRHHVYGITLNNDDGFLPPGLLFGLMYAWYLDAAAAPIMENEMAILHLPAQKLIPHQAQEYHRKKALINFFRTEVFGYNHV